MRVESEYTRVRTLACLAAYRLHRARVLGRCEGPRPTPALFWGVDDGASRHNGVPQPE